MPDALRVQSAWRARIEKRRGEKAQRTGNLKQAGQHYLIGALLGDELGDPRSRELLTRKSAAVLARIPAPIPPAAGASSDPVAHAPQLDPTAPRHQRDFAWPPGDPAPTRKMVQLITPV